MQSTEPSVARPTWVVLLDALLDVVVVTFAGWTVLYEVGLFADLNGWTLTLVWAPLAAAAAGWMLLRAVRAGRSVRDDPAAPVAAGSGSSPVWLRVAGPALVAAAAGLALVNARAYFWPMWLTATVAGALLLWQVRGQVTGQARVDGAPVAGLSHWGALITSTALGVMSMFILRSSTDDVYYVNRSTWVAEHGSIALRDTMFGPETYEAAYGGGAPIASFEALLGTVAHFTGLHAGTVTYLVVVPVGSFLSGWAMWRLIRHWAPRRHLLVLLGAVAFLLMSGGTSNVGDFWLPRMWQGKVPAICVVVPLTWFYLTTWAERRHRSSLLMVAACGVTLTGLTSTAVILAPVMSAAVVLAGLLIRQGWAMFQAAVALSFFPVLMGVVVLLAPSPVGGAEPEVQPPADVFFRVLGDDPVIFTLALVALAAAPVLVRSGAARPLAGSAGLAALGVLAPGLLLILNAVTGSGPIAWRLMFCAPIAVLAGMLLAVPLRLPGRRTATTQSAVVGAAMAVVLVVLLAAGGTPIWERKSGDGNRWSEEPVWKVNPNAYREVRRALRIEHGDGPVLMPPGHMQVMAIYTTESFAVSPRHNYTRTLEADEREVRDRLLLESLGYPPGGEERPSASEVDAALARLDVSMACVKDHYAKVVSLVEDAGYVRTTPVGRLLCLRPPA